jgi:hypothetical protein
MGRGPEYNFEEFVEACGHGNAVVLAMDTAERHFGLKTQVKVLDFISNGGLESPKHANTAELEKSLLPVKPLVDSYDFFSGHDYGYIAFWKNKRTGKWIIKSFKYNTNVDPRNFTIMHALENAKIRQLKKKE